MKLALAATAIFVAGIAPGLWNHGYPVPHSSARTGPPIQAADVVETPRLFGLFRRASS